jgi:hypothetical protein
MSDINRDDVRAAVGAGMISEAQAASLLALSDARRGTREHLTGLDEPFELFRRPLCGLARHNRRLDLQFG